MTDNMNHQREHVQRSFDTIIDLMRTDIEHRKAEREARGESMRPWYTAWIGAVESDILTVERYRDSALAVFGDEG